MEDVQRKVLVAAAHAHATDNDRSMPAHKGHIRIDGSLQPLLEEFLRVEGVFRVPLWQRPESRLGRPKRLHGRAWPDAGRAPGMRGCGSSRVGGSGRARPRSAGSVSMRRSHSAR